MKQPVNTVASVKALLLNISREKGEDFNLILARYALERLLYRLCQSTYADQFVLKGAMLFSIWSEEAHRPTRDIDFLKFGDARSEDLETIFREVAQISVEDDGIEFIPESVRAAAIRDDNEYGGVRTTIQATLGKARVGVQVDVGFGDVVTPEPETIDYPTLLDAPAPRLRTYPRETVVAEKYQAMIHLGMANSRMKDYYDVWVLAHQFDFDGPVLAEAFKRTFERRNTALPAELPPTLSTEFSADESKIIQWRAFVRKGMVTYQDLTLPTVCEFLGLFLMPPTSAITDGRDFQKNWPAKGPWSDA